MKEIAVLKEIENDREVTGDSDYEFLFYYQKSVLLALKELEILDDVQYRFAETRLKERCQCERR